MIDEILRKVKTCKMRRHNFFFKNFFTVGVLNGFLSYKYRLNSVAG